MGSASNAVATDTQSRVGALNRRNAEMQLKRSRVAATRVGANGPLRRRLDAAYKHYYLAVRYGKQVLGALTAQPAPGPARFPARRPPVFGGPAASNVFFENTQKAFKQKGVSGVAWRRLRRYKPRLDVDSAPFRRLAIRGYATVPYKLAPPACICALDE